MSVHSYGSAGGGGGGGFESPSGASQSDPANTATPAHADHARHHSNRSLSQLQMPLQPQAAPVLSGPTLSPPITRQLLAPSPVLPSPENDAATGIPAADSGADGSDTTADFSSFRPAARHGHTGSVELSPLPMLHHLTSAAVHRSSPGHTVQIAPIDPAFAPSSSAALNVDAANGAAPSPSGSAPAPAPAAAAAATGDAVKGTSPSSYGSDCSTPRSQVRSPRSGLLRPRPPDRVCCGCIPWSADPRKRVSFVTIMVGLVVLMVVISSTVVWLLGYYSTLSTVAELTATIRSSVMHDVSQTLNQAMQAPLQAAYDIDNLLTLRWPDLADRTEIMRTPGWLADLSYIAMRYPALSRVGLEKNEHGLRECCSLGHSISPLFLCFFPRAQPS